VQVNNNSKNERAGSTGGGEALEKNVWVTNDGLNQQLGRRGGR